MLGNNRGSPCRIVRSYFDLLFGMNANPMIRHDERAANLVGHVTFNTARSLIYRTQAGAICYRHPMASQTCFFRPGHQLRMRRIPVRVVAVHARDLSAALAPAFIVFHRRHLIGNQRVVRHRILDHICSPGMTLRAWPHLVGDRQLFRIQYGEISRVGAEGG